MKKEYSGDGEAVDEVRQNDIVVEIAAEHPVSLSDRRPFRRLFHLAVRLASKAKTCSAIRMVRDLRQEVTF